MKKFLNSLLRVILPSKFYALGFGWGIFFGVFFGLLMSLTYIYGTRLPSGIWVFEVALLVQWILLIGAMEPSPYGGRMVDSEFFSNLSGIIVGGSLQALALRYELGVAFQVMVTILSYSLRHFIKEKLEDIAAQVQAQHEVTGR